MGSKKTPKPQKETQDQKFSGKFLTRVPPKLHAELVAEAEKEGVSLNLYAACALARNVGYREGLAAGKAATRPAILAMIEVIEATQLVLAEKKK